MSPPATTDDGPARLSCPFCGAYAVERLYLGSMHLDSCLCASCAARWDQDVVNGSYRGRAGRTRS